MGLEGITTGEFVEVSLHGKLAGSTRGLLKQIQHTGLCEVGVASLIIILQRLMPNSKPVLRMASLARCSFLGCWS